MKNMVKKYLKRFRCFWFGGIEGEIISPYFKHRNIDEYEYKRMLDDPIYLDRYGYKVYSEADEDGMIAEIFKRIGVTNKKFVDFGAGNGLCSNSHFLLHQGWSGIWIEGSKQQCENICKAFSFPIQQKRLSVINAFITKDNINDLIGSGDDALNGEIDFLSIDIDGNDYWVWKSITCISPRVVIIEYNAKFPPTFEWIMEYDENHIWERGDEHGASLKAFEVLGQELGYQLVGTSTNGVNAFFVKKDLAENFFPEPATAENLYHSWKGMGIVNYVSGHPSKKYIGK